MSELLDAALAYIRQGFAPVPIPRRQKMPERQCVADPSDHRRGRTTLL